VPVTGLHLNSLPRTAKVEFSIGQAGATATACGVDTITLDKIVGHSHKFSLRGDDADEDACENEVESDDN
jgi:hypothetical protein